jgi:hypothetical protein
MGKFFQQIYYFFPVQLLLLHLKKNTWVFLLWSALFGFVWQQMGNLFGIPYLFLDPEYNHQVSFLSLFIMGIAVGGFTICFHITCYILDAHRFPFLGNVRQPFSKFVLNNSLIPFVFYTVYLWCFIQFQLENTFVYEQGAVWTELFKESGGFLLGLLTAILPMALYFVSTNQDVFKLLAKGVDKRLVGRKIRRVNVMKEYTQARNNRIRVDSYLDHRFRVQSADTVLQDLGTALRVLRQNHLNGFIIQVFVFSQIVLLGAFRDNPYFQIPAAASLVLLATLVILTAGAIALWLGRWANPILLTGLIVVNFISQKEWFESDYSAFGLDYKHQPAAYTISRLRQLSNDSLYRSDYEATLEILEQWKRKASHVPGKKPKMVLFCASGGGQRAAVWVMRCLQYSDSVTQGTLFRNTSLITGASGGLVGASYYRELCLRSLHDSTIRPSHPEYLRSLAQDNLNPIAFTLVVNDLLFKLQKFEYNGFYYLKDRGFAFEQSLNHNTGGILDKRLKDYYQPEREALIPMLILSPTIVNDGRKLFISPQPMSYMTVPDTLTKRSLTRLIKGVEFQRFFEAQQASELRFLSALRMSATFPYVTPNVSLPSEPEMEIMDSGLTDNYGINDAVRFLFVFRKWIAENTSGVIFLSVRDSPREFLIEAKRKQSLLQKIFSPIGSLYTNWQVMQDYTNDNAIEYARSWFKGSMYRIDLQYVPQSLDDEEPALSERDSLRLRRLQKRASLSWRLTEREKLSLYQTIFEENNQIGIQRLQQLLTP